MYVFLLRSVSLSVLYFLLIYLSKVIEVVTLGGLIAGAAICGSGITLIWLLVKRLNGSRFRKQALLFLGSSVLVMDIMNFLPGYTVVNKLGAVFILLGFCVIAVILLEKTEE